LLALPQEKTSRLVGIIDAINVTGERVAGAGLGASLGALAALLLFVSDVGALGAWMAAIARLPFVAGMDGFLPGAFTRIHPRWRTPYVALLVGGVSTALLLIVSLAGQQAEQAYRVLVSQGVILYFIPYLYMFVVLLALQRRPAAADVIRAPGGQVGAYLLGATGFFVTALSIVLACLPGKGIENRPVFFVKLFGSVGVTLIVGTAVYFFGRRRVKVLVDNDG
jgi:amino acid transporter